MPHVVWVRLWRSGFGDTADQAASALASKLDQAGLSYSIVEAVKDVSALSDPSDDTVWMMEIDAQVEALPGLRGGWANKQVVAALDPLTEPQFEDEPPSLSSYEILETNRV